MEFPLIPILDGLLHLAFFMAKGYFLFLLMRFFSEEEAEHGSMRIALIILLLAITNGSVCPLLRDSLPYELKSSARLICGLTMAIVALPLIRVILKPSWPTTFLATLSLTIFAMALDAAAPKLSAKFWPNGPTFAEHMQWVDATYAKTKPQSEQQPTKGPTINEQLESIAKQTATKEVDAMKEKFAKGVTLYASRREFMESMSEQELASYRKEMARFIRKQGLSADRYSLAALQEVKHADVSVLVSLITDSKNMDTKSAIEVIMATLTEMQNSLTGETFTAEDAKSLRNYAALLLEDDRKGAIIATRKALHASAGRNKMAGSVLAALLQAESGLPTALMFASEKNGKSFDGMQRVPVPVSLGIVRVPLLTAEWDEWMAAAQKLKVKGFLTSSNKTVILLDNSMIINQSEIWELEHKGYVYGFRVDEVWNGMVYLSATTRNKTEK